jgi:N-succinyldiaminopimelate aminotransferase
MPCPGDTSLVDRVLLAGGVPKFMHFVPGPHGWRLDPGSLRAAITPRTRAFLVASPAVPTGAVLTGQDWSRVCDACVEVNAWMVHDASLERVLFTGTAHHQPLHYPGMSERTVTVGSASREYRLVGWRVGWIVCPPEASEAIGRAAASNLACPVGVAQQAVALAIESGDSDLARCTRIWQERHDWIVASLCPDFDVIPAQGGWSLVVDLRRLGVSGPEACRRLLAQGIAAMPLAAGAAADVDGFLSLAFSNEPIDRLHDIGARFRRAFGAPLSPP